MQINPEKRIFILFTRKRNHVLNTPLTLDLKPIPCRDKVKYLGVTLDPMLNFKIYIKETLKQHLTNIGNANTSVGIQIYSQPEK